MLGRSTGNRVVNFEMLWHHGGRGARTDPLPPEYIMRGAVVLRWHGASARSSHRSGANVIRKGLESGGAAKVQSAKSAQAALDKVGTPVRPVGLQVD